MRKFLTALMAVMLLLSTLSIAVGASTVEEKIFDGSVADDADKLDLVITEIMADSTNDYPGNETLDAYDYIELYNRGTEAIDLSKYSILMADNRGNPSTWTNTHTFTHKINLVAGNVYNDVALGTSVAANATHAIQNPNSLMLEPGKFAVIWVWSNASFTLSDLYNESLAKDNFKYFRDYYSREESGVIDPLPSDTLLLVAMGATTMNGTAFNTTGFDLTNDNNRIYAIAERTWNLGASGDGDKVLVGPTGNHQLNEKIKCLFQYGKMHKGGVPYVSMGGMSTIYVPSNQVPYIDNETMKAEAAAKGETAKQYADFAERDADKGYEVSYNELAIMTYWENATPGTMMPYQWIYVDEANTPASAKQFTYDGNEFGTLERPEVAEGEEIPENANWKEDALAALKAAKILEGDDVDNSDSEIEREEIVYESQKDIANRNENVINDANAGKKDDGMAPWLLAVIIGGGVLVVAAIAVVVIIVLKKKNAATATDDVATEGEVAVIDDTEATAEEAPAEETPAEEAPAENAEEDKAE